MTPCPVCDCSLPLVGPPDVPAPALSTVNSPGLGLFPPPGGTDAFCPDFYWEVFTRLPVAHHRAPSPFATACPPPGLTPPRLHPCQSADERTCHPQASARRGLARPLPASPATAGPAPQPAMGPASRGDEGRRGRLRGLACLRVPSTAGRDGPAPR